MTKYELDHLPATETGQRMYSRVSPVYDNSRFMKLFYDAIGAEWEPLRKFFTTLREQHFIDTVDWGIEYLEHKYSLEPRPDLSLEERRARLGIKARKFLPLNPAVMEKYILDNFGLKTYLSEDDVGHIHAILNHVASEAGWRKTISWLLTEKPAHLVLDTTIHILSYTGDPPEEATTPSDKIILPDAIPLPKTPAEKKKFRCIHAGGVLAVEGKLDFGLRRPKDSKVAVHAGGVTLVSGHVQINPCRPKDSKVAVHVGLPLYIQGQVLIDSRDKPQLRIKENPTADLAIAGVMIARGDNLAVPPEYDLLKLFFRFPDGLIHRTITLKSPRDDVTKDEIKAVTTYAVQKQLLVDRQEDTPSSSPKAKLIAKRITTLI